MKALIYNRHVNEQLIITMVTKVWKPDFILWLMIDTVQKLNHGCAASKWEISYYVITKINNINQILLKASGASVEKHSFFYNKSCQFVGNFPFYEYQNYQ